MANEPNKEPESEFKSSPLYKGLKALSGGDKPLPEGYGRIGDDDYSGFMRIDLIIKKVLRFFCWLSAIALIVIMLIAFISAVGEKLRGAGVSWAKGIPFSNYIIQYFHIPLVFLAAGYVTLDQGHTRIDLLIQKWPKVEKVAMAIGHVLGAALAFFISYRGVTVTLVKDFEKNIRITSSANAMKTWPFTICHCVGFFLLGVSFVWALVRMIRFWKHPGVNPAVILYPDEHRAPGEGPDDAPVEEPEPKGGEAV